MDCFVAALPCANASRFVAGNDVVRSPGSSFKCSSLRLLAASERKLTDRALYMEFELRHFCKQIDVGAADGAAAKARIGRRQIERLDQAADILQDQRVCD